MTWLTAKTSNIQGLRAGLARVSICKGGFLNRMGMRRRLMYKVAVGLHTMEAANTKSMKSHEPTEKEYGEPAQPEYSYGDEAEGDEHGDGEDGGEYEEHDE